MGATDVIYSSARRLIILLEEIKLIEVEQASAFIYEGLFQDMCCKVKERGLSGADKEAFVFSYFKRREAQLAEEMRDRYPRAAHSFAMKILGARWFERA